MMQKIIPSIVSLLLLALSGAAQVPFQGTISKYILPIQTAMPFDSVLLSYYSSFDGHLLVKMDEEVIIDSEVKLSSESALNYGHFIKKKENAILTIVIDDLYFFKEVPIFNHPYIRLLYDAAKFQFIISYGDVPPND